jgi:hypothetical protein
MPMVRIYLLHVLLFAFTTSFVYTASDQPKKASYFVLREFFDGVEKNKSVSKDLDLSQYSFAAFLKVEPDSITIYGTISTQKLPNKFINDSLFFENDFLGEKWVVIKGKDSYLLKGIKAQEGNSLHSKKSYRYSRKPALDAYLDRWKKEWWSDYSIETMANGVLDEWLNKTVIAGNYKLVYPEKGKEKIAFSEDGKVTGLKYFSRYQVFDYSGTCRPGDQYDYLSTFNDSVYDMYIYRLKGDTLILEDFYSEDCGYVFKLQDVAYKFVKVN